MMPRTVARPLQFAASTSEQGLHLWYNSGKHMWQLHAQLQALYSREYGCGTVRGGLQSCRL